MNNTTKFFALIESKATLLQSCLLHRYFNIIRIKRVNRLISSARNGDEFSLVDLTNILGMDDEEETKDYLEQLGYSVTTSSPVGLLIPATHNQNDQQPINRLSQKLIRSKYQGNLKDVSREAKDKALLEQTAFSPSCRSSQINWILQWLFRIQMWRTASTSKGTSSASYRSIWTHAVKKQRQNFSCILLFDDSSGQRQETFARVATSATSIVDFTPTASAVGKRIAVNGSDHHCKHIR